MEAAHMMCRKRPTDPETYQYIGHPSAVVIKLYQGLSLGESNITHCK